MSILNIVELSAVKKWMSKFFIKCSNTNTAVSIKKIMLKYDCSNGVHRGFLVMVLTD